MGMLVLGGLLIDLQGLATAGPLKGSHDVFFTVLLVC